MVARPPQAERAVVVRLSEIPIRTRRRVAARVVRVEGLVGERALEMLAAAEIPIQDPALTVSADAASRVLLG